MPIVVRYRNQSGHECTLRPTPLISIASNIIKTGGDEAIGITYSITLTGTILSNQGFPYASSIGNSGPYNSFDSSISHSNYNRPPAQNVPWNYKLDAILFKQKVIRSLFGTDGQRMEISPIHGDAPAIICFPRVVSIDFAEGPYFETCDYTITLETDVLFDMGLVAHDNPQDGATLRFLKSVTEDWSIEVDEGVGEDRDHPRAYRISHNMSAVGKTSYSPAKTPAWQWAKKYIQDNLLSAIGSAHPANPLSAYPNILGQIGKGTLDLIEAYRGFNHVRTESIGVTEGSYSVTESWLLATGIAYENYTLSISSEIDTPFVNVGIDGNITGLSEIQPDGAGVGGSYNDTSNNAYDNALVKYHAISNDAQFGLTSSIYNRANNAVAVQLNSQPKSISLGMDEFGGSITYNLSFDNRPVNIIQGALSESIQVNDTYPGDIMAQIPVIGRATGPVLQYIGGRTEYRRDVSIEIVMDYTDIPYTSGRNLMLMKPSTNEPTKGQLMTLIKMLSPEKEPGIRKYFISPPSENWSPKEGRYSLNISWVYELDK